jgi:quinol monooxygenase YgiN
MTVEVIATLEARPERETEVEAALRVLLTHSRQEPGVRRYDLYRDSARSATFHLIEAYADEAALEAHRQSAHYLRYREQAGDWLLAAPRVAVLDPVAVARDE